MSQGKTDRDQRLAEALRANLRRRKGQARERDDVAPPPVGDVEPEPSDASPAGKN
jgi:hypothetical protein